MLYINGTDISYLVLGVMNQERTAFIVDPVRIDVAPEGHLQEIMGFCEANACNEPTGIVAVCGPGSATALRSSLTIANTFAFVRGLLMFRVILESGLDDLAALIALRDSVPVAMLRPEYEHAARITKSKKGLLKR